MRIIATGALLLAALPALALEGEVNALGGVLALGAEHELYEQQFLHQAIRPAGVLGARIGWYPNRFIGSEAEGRFGLGRTAITGDPVSLWTGGVQAVGGFNLNDPTARVIPFLTVGADALGLSSTVLGNDADLGAHWGLGAKVAINHRIRVRIDGRHILSSKFREGGIASHFAVDVGFVIRLGAKPPPSTKSLILELLSAYESPPTGPELASLGDDVDEALMAIAQDPDIAPSRRGRAVTSLSQLPPEPETQAFLEEIFTRPDAPAYMRRKALVSIAIGYPEEGRVFVQQALEDTDDLQMQWAAVHFLRHASEQADETDPLLEEFIEEKAPHVTFILQGPDGEPVNMDAFEIVGPFSSRPSEFTGKARIIDPRLTGEEEWTVRADGEGCLGVEITIIPGDPSASVPIQLTPMREELVDLVIRDANGEPIEGVEIEFQGGDPYCAPDGAVISNGTDPIAVGPGQYTVIIRAPGFEPREEVITVEAGVPVTMEAELEPTFLSILTDRIQTDPIHFASGRTTILASSLPILDELADVLTSGAHGDVRIEGHTDSQGSAASNQAISLLRAQAVRRYLTDAGVEADTLIAVGIGEDQPIATNDTNIGRTENRRVEFILLDVEEPTGEPVESPGTEEP